jgi:ABC-type transport system involved in multi-copper enzyme maturation permease subunit
MTAVILHYLRGLSPVGAALSILKPRLSDFGGVERGMVPLWMIFLPLATAVCLVSLTLISIRLRKAPSTMEGFGAPKTGTDRKRSFGRRLMFLIDPTVSRKPLGRGNPIIGKERRSSNMRSGSWMIRIFYVSLFLSLALAVMALYGGTEHADLMRYVVQVLIALQIALITLVVPSLSTGSISGEIENGTFELLRLAPLSASRVFWGKLLPALVPALLPMIALLPAYGALCFIDRSYITRLLQIAPVVALAVVVMCTLGLTCSAWASSTARATVAAYLIACTMVIGPMLVWSAGEAQLVSMASAKWLAALSPMVMSMNLLPDSRPEIAALRTYHLWAMGGLCVVMLLLARAKLISLLRHG